MSGLPASLTAECLAERASRGPRYTSYPPATELGDISADEVVAELGRVRDDARPISLYAHVPFCESLCWYCGCNVIPTRDRSRGERYVDMLTTELAILAKVLGVGFPVAEIALGGGSPNFLSARALRTLILAIDRYFSRPTGARLSVELDPRTATSIQIDAFAACGFRVMSMGVQDFEPRVQDAIHRHQSVVQTRWLVDRARASGFTDLNVDIVYGLPRQTAESFAKTLHHVISLDPDRIALFGYAHLPDRLPHQRLVERDGRVLDRFERATLLLLAIDRLTAAGYVHLGLDHFAKPGSPLARAASEHRMARTFQGYVERRADTVIGVGTSSISTTPRMFWQNHSELAAWEADVANARVPVARGLTLQADDRIRRSVIEHLMCHGEVDLDVVEQRHGVDPLRYLATELASLREHADLAWLDGHVVRTTPLGKLLVRNVCMVFDRYQRNPGQFSSTI